MSIRKIWLLVCMSTRLLPARVAARVAAGETCGNNLDFLMDKFSTSLQPAVRRVTAPSQMHCVSACLSDETCHFLIYSGQRCKMFRKSNETGRELTAISTGTYTWPQRFKMHRLHLKPVKSLRGRFSDFYHHTRDAQQTHTTSSSTVRRCITQWKPNVNKPQNGPTQCMGVAQYDYIPKTNMCVRYVKGNLVTWEEARGHCREDGGDLVKLDTRRKYLAVYYHLKRNGLAGFGSFGMFEMGYWIGLKLADQKGVWVDGTPMSFNKLKGWTLPELTKCVTGLRSVRANWDIYDCTKQSKTFMCEIEPQEPSSNTANDRLL